MPHLRICIGKHKNARWWKEMSTAALDVEEVHTSDVQEIYEKLLRRSYNLKDGPLWCVRFITLPQSEIEPYEGDGRYKYVCLFGFHHNMSDGTTNMNFCNIFLSLLNSVLLKKHIDLKEEGRFASPIHDDISREMWDIIYLTRIYTWRTFKSICLCWRNLNNFLTEYPLPSPSREPCTRVICKEFDHLTTTRMLNRCKMEGVTLNSAFTAAANLAMYAMILENNNTVKESYFNSQQAVNMRRYWPKDKRQNSYGCHISMLDFSIPTYSEDLENFWEYTRRIHATVFNDLNVTKRALKINPLAERLGLAININNILAKMGVRIQLLDSHYCITNMGNVSSMFSGEGEVVSVSRILRSVTCHFMQALCQHTLQTFKGKFYYSLDYYPRRMQVEIARTYSSNIMDTLRKSIHTPN